MTLDEFYRQMDARSAAEATYTEPLRQVLEQMGVLHLVDISVIELGCKAGSPRVPLIHLKMDIDPVIRDAAVRAIQGTGPVFESAVSAIETAAGLNESDPSLY